MKPITVTITGRHSEWFNGAPDSFDLPVQQARTVRVSHILPVNRLKRSVFVALRFLFGESGRVSDWTRQWTGPWQARFLEVSHFRDQPAFTNQDRDACLDWERRIIEGDHE